METVTHWLGLVGSAFAVAAPVAAVVAALYRYTLGARLKRIEDAIAPNGHENEGHPDDHGVPIRTLVLRNARETRAIKDSLDAGDRWMGTHTVEHVRRDSTWPAQEGRSA